DGRKDRIAGPPRTERLVRGSQKAKLLRKLFLPEPLFESEDQLDHMAHLEPTHGVLFVAQRRRETDAAHVTRTGPEKPQWQRYHQSAAGERCASRPRATGLDSHRAWRPADIRGDGFEMHTAALRRDLRLQRVGNADVAGHQAKRTIAFDLAFGISLALYGADADTTRIGRVIGLDPHSGQVRNVGARFVGDLASKELLDAFIISGR